LDTWHGKKKINTYFFIPTQNIYFSVHVLRSFANLRSFTSLQREAIGECKIKTHFKLEGISFEVAFYEKM